MQQAWIEEQTPQCGFCQNGMMIKATELLESNPNPTLVQIKEAFTTSGMSPNLCRCGTYTRDHRRRTTCRHDHGEGEVSDGNHERKAGNVFGATLIAPAICESRRRTGRRCQPGGPGVSEGRYRKVRCLEELARSDAPQFLDRDSSGQHGPHSHREERLRTGHDFHGLPANRGRRVERALRSDHTVVQGDTDRTPDGSGAFDFLGRGTPNIRKAAAYTYQALLDLASEKLGVAKDKLSVEDGVVSGGGKSISYGDLVKGQQLKLTIPVTGDLTSIMGLRIDGDPPMKPVSQYTVIGKSFKNSVISSKVAAKETWATDVRLPGMFTRAWCIPRRSARLLFPPVNWTKPSFPNSQVIVKGNLVGVVAPTEWEAIQAANQVARDTKWTEWKGLPGNEKLYQHLREEADWKSAPVAKGEAIRVRLNRRSLRRTRSFPQPTKCRT